MCKFMMNELKLSLSQLQGASIMLYDIGTFSVGRVKISKTVEWIQNKIAYYEDEKNVPDLTPLKRAAFLERYRLALTRALPVQKEVEEHSIALRNYYAEKRNRKLLAKGVRRSNTEKGVDDPESTKGEEPAQ